MQVFDQPGFGGMAVALVRDVMQPAARQQRVAHRGRGGQHGFLLHQRHAQSGLALHLAVVERQRAREHA
jgi:hypothetical protein